MYIQKLKPDFLRNYCVERVPTSSGNHGKPGKSQIKIPCMEKSWNLIKAEKSWNFAKSVVKLTARGNYTLKSVKSQEKLDTLKERHIKLTVSMYLSWLKFTTCAWYL